MIPMSYGRAARHRSTTIRSITGTREEETGKLWTVCSEKAWGDG